MAYFTARKAQVSTWAGILALISYGVTAYFHGAPNLDVDTCVSLLTAAGLVHVNEDQTGGGTQ